MGCKGRSDASKSQVDPESKQRWGGDLCTTPAKEFREPRVPRGDGSEIGGTEDRSYLKATEAECPRTTGSEEPSADYGEKTTGTAEPSASYSYQPSIGSGGPRKRDCGAPHPFVARSAPDGQV